MLLPTSVATEDPSYIAIPTSGEPGIVEEAKKEETSYEDSMLETSAHTQCHTKPDVTDDRRDEKISPKVESLQNNVSKVEKEDNSSDDKKELVNNICLQ